ncbi:MAG: universal stress protein [Desulfobacterales bacterium]|jgi:nucleotide-binding universal stress UspA family protein
MLPQIKRILYATDLSDNSAFVFRYAINSAKHHDAGMTILHVLEKISPTTETLIRTYLSEEDYKELFSDKVHFAMERIRKRLEIFCEKELKDGPKGAKRVEAIEICEGFPADEILQKADELSCDAIIMGTHGKGIISQTFLGSTAKRVLRRTRKPVFIIPMPKGDIDITFHGI